MSISKTVLKFDAEKRNEGRKGGRKGRKEGTFRDGR
jgi:hypothetical protein